MSGLLGLAPAINKTRLTELEHTVSLAFVVMHVLLLFSITPSYSSCTILTVPL